jgi:hypothetical protein
MRTPRFRARALSFVLVSGGLLLASTAGAQGSDEFAEEPAGLVYTIDSQPVRGHAELTGRNRFQGPMPLTVPAELRGEYGIQVTAPGYEEQRGILRFAGSGAPLELVPPEKSFARTCIWPGFATMTSGQSDPVRGLGLALAAGVGVTGLVGSEIRRRGADEATSPAEPGDLESETEARIQTAKDQGTADAARSARTDWAIFTAATWGLSLLDTYAFAPGIGGSQVDLTDATFNLRPLSKPKAVFRSLLAPGFGQSYARRHGASVLFYYGALGSLTGLLIAEQAYEESLDQLSALEGIYDDPGADPEALVIIHDEIDRQSGTAGDRHKLRNIMAGVTASVWAINLVDAWIGTPTPEAPREGAARDGAFRLAVVVGPEPGCRLTIPF